MAKPKVDIPDNLFEEQPGAIQKLTGGSQPRPATPPPPPTSTETTREAQPAKTRNVKPTSFYLTPQQLRKLDDLAYTYNGRTGQRINRNDIIRHLVDTCDMGDLQGL